MGHGVSTFHGEALIVGPLDLTVTSVSQLLPTLMGSTAVPTQTRYMIFRPASTGVSWARSTAAVSGTNPVPSGGIGIPIRPADLALLQFITSGADIHAQILLFG